MSKFGRRKLYVGGLVAVVLVLGALWVASAAPTAPTNAAVVTNPIVNSWSAADGAGDQTRPLATVTLQAPADGSTPTLPVTLQWSAVDNATSYLLQIAKEATFAAPMSTRSVTGTSFTWHDPAVGTYYWRVRALKPGTEGGNWSDAWSFTSPGKPPAD
jgi:hypothetical protein